VGIEPTTLGSRCNPSLHHAANSPIFFFPSLLLYSSSAHTPSVRAATLAKSTRHKFPGGISVHGLSGFEPEPCGLSTEVTVNFTIPSAFFRRKLSVLKAITRSL